MKTRLRGLEADRDLVAKPFETAHQLRGAIVPGRLELHHDAAVTTEPEAILRQRRAEHIAALCGPGSYAELQGQFAVVVMGSVLRHSA